MSSGVYTLSTPLTASAGVDGAAVGLTTARGGQDMRIAITASAGQILNIGLNASRYGNVELLRPDGTLQNTNTLFTDSKTDIDTAPLPVAGVYTVRIDPYALGTGTYTVTVSMPLTGALSVDGATQAVNISRGGQDARYTLSATAGQILNIGLVNGGYYADVELIRPDGTVQNTASLFSGSQTDIETAPLATTGVYTLRIDPNSLGTGVYSMTVSTPATGTLSINGAAQLVTITRPGQDGWLTFNGVAGQVLTLTTVTPSSRATDIYVYTPSGAQLTSDYAYGTSNLKLPTLSSTGVYSVRIDPWSSYTGVYTLSLSAPVA